MPEKLTSTPKSRSLILTQRFEQGSCVYTCVLTTEDEKKIREIIEWLKEHAAGNWGGTLSEFQLHQSDSKITNPDCPNIDKVLGILARESRYYETKTPGDYYFARNAELDKVDPAP